VAALDETEGRKTLREDQGNRLGPGSYRSIYFQRADDDGGSIAPMEASENVLLG
jgi:hypothetical protein